jgi:hypothetical protein
MENHFGTLSSRMARFRMKLLNMKRSGCLRRFGGPNKEMRSISRAGKMCRNNGVGMERSAMT